MTPSPARARRPPRLVTVVIPVRDGAPTLPDQLQALERQDYKGEWELVVADNGSRDGSGDIARGWAPTLPLRVVDASARRGLSFALNTAWRAARGELVATCDADDIVSDGWLRALVGAATDADIVGGAFEYRRLNDPTVRAWNVQWRGTGPWITLDYMPFFTSGNVAIWRDILEELGGFNEHYVIGGNDVELSWRAGLSAYRFRFEPGAVVHYRYRQDLRGLALQAYRYGRSEPHLYRDFREHGMPRVPAGRTAMALTWLVLAAPLAAVLRRVRGRWVRIAAHRAGRLAGSLRHRVLYV